MLSLRDDGTITFPAGAVDTVTQVSATWVPQHTLEALDLPVGIDRGGGYVGVPRAALFGLFGSPLRFLIHRGGVDRHVANGEPGLQ